MQATISDVIQIMNEIAPSAMAEDWDNVGLQIGDKDWPVKKIWVSLDPLLEVMEKGCRTGVDLIVTHHPLIFRPVKSIDFSNQLGSIIQLALQHHTGIFSAHTNLDSVQGGINDFLAKKLGLKNLAVLEVSRKPLTCKLVVYVPSGHEENILTALFEAGAGKIGSYSKCSFRNEGTGTFLPGFESRPFKGGKKKLSRVSELRIETVVNREDLNDVLDAVRKYHPYETMACDVFALETPVSWGLGRVGEVETPVTLDCFVKDVKERLGLDWIKVSGDPGLQVQKVAACTGSGSGLMKSFLASPAQVYISGDLHYHDARAAEQAKRALIDIGHFSSEHFVVDMLSERLEKAFCQRGFEVDVEPCLLEKDPFRLC